MQRDIFFIIDFDSTFTKVEGLDVLCDISLRGKKGKKEALQEIQKITDLGMEGKISFRESLVKRLHILKAHKSHLEELTEKLKAKVSISFVRNRNFFKTYKDRIFIISNGFREFILPIVKEYGVKEENVFANDFTYDEAGNITGFNPANILSQDGGKVALLKELKLPGEVYVIGDGYNDYQIKAAGLANKFYAFTENIIRESVLKDADHIAPSLDEFLYLNKMNTALSYPIKFLLTN